MATSIRIETNNNHKEHPHRELNSYNEPELKQKTNVKLKEKRWV